MSVHYSGSLSFGFQRKYGHLNIDISLYIIIYIHHRFLHTFLFGRLRSLLFGEQGISSGYFHHLPCIHLSISPTFPLSLSVVPPFALLFVFP